MSFFLFIFGERKVAENLTKDDLVVVLLPDSGRGYLSKIFNPIWMTKMGFLDNNDSLLYKSVHDAVKSKNLGTTEPVSYTHLRAHET